MTKSDFLPRIESLRGVAALTVVGFHVHGQLSANPAYGWFDWLGYRMLGALSNGVGAVVTFFVLSGFVLARSLDRNSELVRFFRNRVFRLFPAAMFVVALLTVLHRKFGFFVGYEASFEPVDVVLNMLMVKSDINGVMWSMTVECVATPLVPLSVWIFRRHGAGPLWVSIAVLLALSFWGPYVHLLGGFTNLAPQPGAAICIRRRSADPFSRRRCPFDRPPASDRGPCRDCRLRLLRYQNAKRARSDARMHERRDRGCADGLSSGHDPVRAARFPAGPVLRANFLQLLFAASAGHRPCFRALEPLALDVPAMPVSLSMVFATAASILITTPAAYLAWRFIEAPAVRFGRMLGAQPEPQPAG